MGKILRPYQSEAVRHIINSDKDLIICLPTGAGKTVIASEVIKNLSGTVIFIVPRLELIEQAKNEFEFETDTIWSSKTCLTGKHCIVASKDSLRTQADKLEPGEYILIFDEAHISIEQSYNLVQKIKPKRVLGLTATPERMDGLALLKGSDAIHKFGIFDELLKAETVPSLIRKGFLTPLHYYAKPIENITNIRPDSKAGDELSGSQMTKIFNENGIWGDLVSSYETYGKGRPAIGFTTTIDMAAQVTKLFNDAGYNFKVISGDMSVSQRSELIDELKTKKIDGLVNAALLTYGFDCPEASYAFSCRHIKSRPLWFQMIGRILRLSEGKTDAIFVDHGDSISEFSEPNCALPIMDELIDWRVNGEDKNAKQARKKNLKKVQDTMKIIQKLDPLPADMVEVTMEDTYDRLIRIIQRLTAQNKKLMADRNKVENENKQKTEYIKEQELENEKLKVQLKKNQKKIDSDKTFEYIKYHYCAVRRDIEDRRPGHTPDEYHEMTEAALRYDEDKLDFYFDNAGFKRSMNYWKNNYKRDWTPGSRSN